MSGMTAQERYDEICKLSGMSEDVVRRVLAAEKESVINSLKRGERATLMGRCVMRPEIKKRFGVGGSVETYIKVTVDAAPSLKTALEECSEYEKGGAGDNLGESKGIKLNQIPHLL